MWPNILWHFKFYHFGLTTRDETFFQQFFEWMKNSTRMKFKIQQRACLLSRSTTESKTLCRMTHVSRVQKMLSWREKTSREKKEWILIFIKFTQQASKRIVKININLKNLFKHLWWIHSRHHQAEKNLKESQRIKN